MSKLEQAWQGRGLLACVLWPVSILMRGLVGVRRWLYRLKILRTKKASVPVIVVGNINVGGTGKSPLTAALVSYFQEMDWRPGIVSKGYGGNNTKTPQNVLSTSNPTEVGDEPVMLAGMTGVPVCVCGDRAAAVQAIVDQHNVNLVFSDDGLQHYAMARDAEIVVVDESRGFENGWLMPAGPLREPLSRLKSVSLVAIHRTRDAASTHSTHSFDKSDLSIPNGLPCGHFQLAQTHLLNINDVVDKGYNEQCAQENLAMLSGQTVHAVAGIGDPSRFFRQLTRAGLQIIEHPKPDHHVWSVSDLQFNDEHPIVITSKDAVKVIPLMSEFTGTAEVYEVCVKAILSADLSNALAAVEDDLHKIYRQPQQGIR